MHRQGSLVQFNDHASLYQHPKSLECALVFEGRCSADTSSMSQDDDAAERRACDRASKCLKATLVHSCCSTTGDRKDLSDWLLNFI